VTPAGSCCARATGPGATTGSARRCTTVADLCTACGRACPCDEIGPRVRAMATLRQAGQSATLIAASLQTSRGVVLNTLKRLSTVLPCDACPRMCAHSHLSGPSRCGGCDRTLPRDAFGSRAGKPHLRRGQCKECSYAQNRKWHRDNPQQTKALNKDHGLVRSLRRIGLVADPFRPALEAARKHYDEMLTTQGGKCAICGTTPIGRRLAIDHCHETGAIRGLLCDPCNRGLGDFRDRPLSLRSAADYLERSRRLEVVA
jgi:hypothetical protein